MGLRRLAAPSTLAVTLAAAQHQTAVFIVGRLTSAVVTTSVAACGEPTTQLRFYSSAKPPDAQGEVGDVRTQGGKEHTGTVGAKSSEALDRLRNQTLVDYAQTNLTVAKLAVEQAKGDVVKERLKVSCLEGVWGKRGNLTADEYAELLGTTDPHTADFIREVTTIDPYDDKDAEQKLKDAEQKLKDAEQKLKDAELKLEKAELKLEKAELKLEKAEAKQKTDTTVSDAKKAILALPDQVSGLSDSLEGSGIVTTGDVFRDQDGRVKEMAGAHGLVPTIVYDLLHNPHLKLLDYPVANFVSSRIFSHKDVSNFTMMECATMTLRQWGNAKGESFGVVAPPIRTILDDMSKHLLNYESLNIRAILHEATAMRPLPMTHNHARLLGLDLIGDSADVVKALRVTGDDRKENRPVRFVVSPPQSGMSRVLDEIAVKESKVNPPMTPGQPLIVKTLVVNMTYNSPTPVQEVEAERLPFYRCFWGRFLRGCAHPLIPNLFGALVDTDNGTSCTPSEILDIIEEVYGISGYENLVVNVDGFSRVLDKHKGKNYSPQSEYSSFYVWLAQGAQFSFGGLHSKAVHAFLYSSGRPLRNYLLPTLSLSDLHKHQAAACIINAVAVSRGEAFPLADFEASKTSVGLMGCALEACGSDNESRLWFHPPWEKDLLQHREMHRELLFDSLKLTLRGKSPNDDSERAGLAIRRFDMGELSIHPYALYSLLNAMVGTSDLTTFESAVLDMWKSFSGAVHDYHCAISGAHNTSAVTANSAPDTQKAKGPMLETLLRHVLHLRALSVGGKSCRFAEVERFPTLVDTRMSESEAIESMDSGIAEIRKLVESIGDGEHVVLNATALNNVAAASVLQRQAGELRIDIYVTKHFDDPMAKNELLETCEKEHLDKYVGALVGILHLRRNGALPGNVVIQFHYVAVLHPSDMKQEASGLTPEIMSEACKLPPEYAALLDPPVKTFTIDELVGLLRADGVVVAGDRIYRTQVELERLLTRPLLYLLPIAMA